MRVNPRGGVGRGRGVVVVCSQICRNHEPVLQRTPSSFTTWTHYSSSPASSVTVVLVCSEVTLEASSSSFSADFFLSAM